MVHKDEMCAFFKTLSSVDRIEIICGMLQLCVPQELRFVGAFLEDIIQKNFSYFSDLETVANDINQIKELSKTKINSDKEFYARLNMYLSLLHSDNNVCAEAIFSILEEIKDNLELHFDQDPVLKNISEKESDFLNDVILVFTLASYHPAFTIKQRLYMYEVCKSMKESLKKTTLLNKKTEETTFSSQGLSPLKILVEPLKSIDNDQSCLIEVYWVDGHKTKCYRSKGDVQSFISQFSNAFPSVKLLTSADVFDTLKSLLDDLLQLSKSIVNSDFILNFLQDSEKSIIDDDEEDDEYDDANDEDDYDEDDYVSSDNRLDTSYTKIHQPANHQFFNNNDLNQPGVSGSYASYIQDSVKTEELSDVSGGDIYQSHMNFPKDQCHIHSSCFECIKKNKRISQHYTYDKLTNGVLYDSSSSSSSSSGGADNCSTSSCNNNIDEEAEDKLRGIPKKVSMTISPLSSSSVASSPPTSSSLQSKNVSNDSNEHVFKQNQSLSSQLSKAFPKNNFISPTAISNSVTPNNTQTPPTPFSLNQVSSKSSSNTQSISISLASISSSSTLTSKSLGSNVLANKNSSNERISKLSKKLKKPSHSKFSRYDNSSTNNMTSDTTPQVTNMIEGMKGCEEVLADPLMQCCMPDCHMLPGGGDHSIKHHNVLKSPQTYPVLAMFQSPSDTPEGSVQDKNASTKPLRPILGASANQNMTCSEAKPTDSSKPPISTLVTMQETPLIVSDSYPIHLFPPQAPPFHYFLGTVFNNANNPDFIHPPFSHFSPMDYHSARMHPPPNLHPPNQATSNSGAQISNSNNLPPYYNIWNHPRSPHILFRHMPPPYPHIIRDNQIIIPPPPLPHHLTFENPCSIINTTHPPPAVVPSPINNNNHDPCSNNNTNNNNNLTVVDVANITNRKGKNNPNSTNNSNNNNTAGSIISSSNSVVHLMVTTAMPNNNVIRTDLNNNSNVNNNNSEMSNVNDNKNITNNIDCKVKYSNAVKSSISSIPNLITIEKTNTKNNNINLQSNENKVNDNKNHSVSNKTDVTTKSGIVISTKSKVSDRREFCYNCGSQQHTASSCTETLMVALGQSAQFKLKTVPKAKTASS